MHEPKLSVSSKGKAREDTHWQLGWWDLWHAVEGTRRPLAWAKSSIILTAHPNQPQVLARHFPSSRQFAIPSPQPIASSPASYESPTVISLYPTDDWLFAYFPGRGGDGVGCLWRRGPQLNNWTVREWWPFLAGAGVVAADWTCSHREWVTTESGSSLRLPTRGPITPVLSSTLILVTQDHELHICLLLPFVSSLKILRASLLHAGTITEGPTSSKTFSGSGGVQLCTNAAIGLNYDDSSILVAMRSRILPSEAYNSMSHNAMDVNLELDGAQPPFQSDIAGAPEWELWGEESSICLCEVSFIFKPGSLSLTTKPMSPITCVGRHLTDLNFFSGSAPVSTASGIEEPPRADGQHETRKSGMYLSATFMDFGDYSDTPKSEIRLFSIAHTDPSSSDGIRHAREESKRLFEDTCLSFVLSWPSRNLLLAGLLDLSGSVSRRTEASIGRIVVLKVPDLTNAHEWESPSLMANVHSIGRDVPASVAISPSHALLCTVSSSTFLGTPLSIHALPRRHHPSSSPTKLVLTSKRTTDLSRGLVTAMHARHSPSDVVHALAVPSVSIETVVSTLSDAMSLLDRHAYGLSEMLTGEMFGVATEVYSERSKRTGNETAKADLTARSRAAHDVCSLSACCSAFEDCLEGDTYDLDAVWQLGGLASWLTEFAEKVLKACVLTGDYLGTSNSLKASVKQELVVPMPSTVPALDSPVFLHLVHPYALARLQAAVAHVKRFRDYIASLTAAGENAQMAQNVILDVVDCCGVDLDSLGRLLGEALHDAKAADADDLRRSLSACCPVPSMHPYLRKTIEKLAKSEVVDRPRLFIKATDLVDGITRMSVSEQPAKEIDTDVVSKGRLLRHTAGVVCVRCGGKSGIPPPASDGKLPLPPNLRWQTWESNWVMKCVCGGSWARTLHN